MYNVPVSSLTALLTNSLAESLIVFVTSFNIASFVSVPSSTFFGASIVTASLIIEDIKPSIQDSYERFIYSLEALSTTDIKSFLLSLTMTNYLLKIYSPTTLTVISGSKTIDPSSVDVTFCDTVNTSVETLVSFSMVCTSPFL